MDVEGSTAELRSAFSNAEAEPSITLLVMAFEASDADALLAHLSRYVVLARGEPGCRNIDLCLSASRPSRFVVLQKWEDEQQARAHFDSPTMVEMAEACRGLLSEPPDIELLDSLSAHDLA